MLRTVNTNKLKSKKNKTKEESFALRMFQKFTGKKNLSNKKKSSEPNIPLFLEDRAWDSNLNKIK